MILDCQNRQCIVGGAWAKPSKAFPLNYPRGSKLHCISGEIHARIYPLEQHIRFLRSFLNAYKGDSDEIGILHTNLIERALTHVYGLINIDFKTTAQYILDNFKSEDYPIFSDVYDTIQQWLTEIEKQSHPDRAEIERHKVCLAFLEPIAYGADANLFNGHTNVDLSANVINFNLSALQDNTGSRVLATQYYNVLSYIWTDIISDPFNRRKQLYRVGYCTG